MYRHLSTTDIPTNQQAWVAPTLTNGWINFGTPYAVAGYMKDSLGFVHIKGVVSSGTMSAAIFTLPAGYRPLESHDIATASNGAFGILLIENSGMVIANVGSSGWVSIEATFKGEV